MNHLNFIVPLTLVILFCLVHFLYRNKEKNTRLGKNTKLQEAEQDYQFLRSQIEMQEQTFQKISTEIHDNILLMLSLSKLYLHDIDYNNHSELHDKINLSIFLLKKAITDLNNLSKSLSAENIEKFGLVKALEDQIAEVRKADLFAVNFSVRGVQRSIGCNNELILFRMIQESFNNIIKHSQAEYVDIILEYRAAYLSIHIKDNGIGFSTDKIHSGHSGSGLNNMHKRARMLNAHLIIKSDPHGGTTIKIQVPVNSNIHINANRQPAY